MKWRWRQRLKWSSHKGMTAPSRRWKLEELFPWELPEGIQPCWLVYSSKINELPLQNWERMNFWYFKSSIFGNFYRSCQKPIGFVKDTVKGVERQTMDWEKISVKYISAKGLVSKIFKDTHKQSISDNRELWCVIASKTNLV